MEKPMGRTSKPHCLVVPFPVQGHINPMLQFSKRLQSKGIQVTFAPTQFIFNTTMKGCSSSISMKTISDGHDEGGFSIAENTEAYMARFQEIGSKTLIELINKLKASSDGQTVDLIVYNSTLPWVLDIARGFGILGAVFFTQSCAVENIYYHVYRGNLKIPVVGPEVCLPGLPPLSPSDLPSFIYSDKPYPCLLGLALSQFSNIHEADWVLF